MHTEDETAAKVVEKVPAAHLVHMLDVPVVLWYWPVGHELAQVLEPKVEYVPSGQV